MSSAGPFIISVTGARSGIGKTTVCTILLKEFREFGAVKFTKTLGTTSLTDDPGILGEKGKDTSRLLAAGARRVVWIRSSYNDLAHVLDKAMEKMQCLRGIVVEGNSPVDFLNPDLIIFTIGSDGKIKPSAVNVSRKADIVIVNAPGKPGKPSFLSGKVHPKSKVFWIDFVENTGETDEFISLVRKRVNKIPYTGKGL